MHHLLHRGTGAGEVGGGKGGRGQALRVTEQELRVSVTGEALEAGRTRAMTWMAARPGQAVQHPGQSHTAPHTRVSVNLRASLKHRPLLCIS